MKLALALVLLPASLAFAQGTAADYERSRGLRTKFQDLALDVPGPANWIAGTPTFWYRKTVKGGAQFILVDAEKQEKRPAFDHEKLADALGTKYTGVTLPFQEFTLVEKEPRFRLLPTVRPGAAHWPATPAGRQALRRRVEAAAAHVLQRLTNRIIQPSR